MAEQRLVAAFYLSSAVRLSPSDLPDLARRAGVEAVRTAAWGPDGSTLILGRWGGLECESSLLPLAYYDVFLVTFRQDEFRNHWLQEQRDAIPEGARVIADTFAAACRALSPLVAIQTSYAWVDPGAFLSELEERVISGDVSSLAREHVWLLYVPSSDADLLRSNLPESAHELVAVPGGTMMVVQLDRYGGS